MKTFFVAVLFLLCLSSVSFSQQEPVEYLEAKKMISSGDYVEAMNKLRPFMDEQQYGGLAPFASFHFARAAYENGQYELVKSTLTPLMESRWRQADQARYLSALANFKQNRFSEALALVKEISTEPVKNEAFRASYGFLKELPASILMVQVEQFGENAGLAFALKEKLMNQPSLSSQEKEVLQRVQNISLPQETIELPVSKREVNQTLEIAVVLPFNYNGGSGVQNLQSNNFVFELYRGILFAVDQAKQSGVDVEVRTFDTERNTSVLATIMTDPFFARADIIIGPIYPEEVELMAGLAGQLGVPFVNPLSNIQESVKVADQSFLFRPSVEALAQSTVDYLKRYSGKRVAVAYSAASRDELLAKSFVEKAPSAGIQIVRNQQVNGRNMRDYLDRTVQASGVDALVIFSDDPNVAAPTFSLVESQSASIPIVVMDSWLYFNFASYEMMESQDFHFIGNNTVNLGSSQLGDFRKRFFDTYKSYPGLNAYLGYEMIHWISSVINQQKGFDFQENLAKSNFVQGDLTFGFDFSHSAYNAYVPVLKLVKGEIVIE